MKLKDKKVFIFIIFSSLIISVALSIFTFKTSNDNSEIHTFSEIINKNYKNTLTIGDKTIKIDIADDQEEATTGLSGRKSMCDDCGMYFELGYDNTIPTFWMKDMLFPIDIIWIDDGVIVDISKNIPAPEPGTKDSQLPKYQPKQKVDNVLEVNAGYADQLGIEIGDSVIPEK